MTTRPLHHAAGLLVAAGGGSRFGMPKALAHDAAGDSWLVRGVQLLLDAGCSPVVVVLGARAAEAEAILASTFSIDSSEGGIGVVRAERWQTGMAASLDAGLAYLQEVAADSARERDGALLTLVDLPTLTLGSAERVLGAARLAGADALAQATYGGRPGHPVYIGRHHWTALRSSLEGDRGARAYLVAHSVTEVDCSDFGGGDDVDSLDI